jgi:hypothetical protein
VRNLRKRSVLYGAFFAFLGLFAFAVGSLRAQQDAGGVHVFSCTLVTKPGESDLAIYFRNDDAEPLTSITWRAKYGTGWIDATTKGTFAQGVVIHKERLGPTDPSITQRFVSLDGPGNCRTIATTSASNKSWRDTTIPDQSIVVPTVPPDDATPVPHSIDNPFSDPIGVIGCHLSVLPGKPSGIGPKNGRGALFVRFRNLSTRPIDRVVFRAWYGSGGFDFIDGGAFAPGVLQTSTHYFLGLPTTNLGRVDLPIATPEEYASLDSPNNCATVSAHFVDGTTWQNPTTGATEPPVPTPVPDADGK